MKIISFEDVRSLGVSPEYCYKWASEMILHKKETFLPAKTHMNMPGNIFCNVMPALIPCANGTVGGIKVVTRYPERKPSLDSKILFLTPIAGAGISLP